MENKTLYIIVVLAIILGVSAGVYFTMGDRIFNVNSEKDNIMPRNIESKKQNSDFFIAEDNQEDENLKNEENNFLGEEDKIKDTNESGIKDAEQEERNVLANEYFSINLPQGWRGSPAPVGVSAMAVNANEDINDPVAKKMNFKSYFAISFDSLQERSKEEYVEYIKNTIKEAHPTLNIISEKQIIVNGEDARAIEIELTQQGSDFKILMVLVWGKGGDVWIISFNTTSNKWEDYKNLLYQTINSFQIKQ